MNQPRLFTRWRKQLAAVRPLDTAPEASHAAVAHGTQRCSIHNAVRSRSSRRVNDRSTTFPEECTVTSTSLPDSLIATLPGSSYTDPGGLRPGAGAHLRDDVVLRRALLRPGRSPAPSAPSRWAARASWSPAPGTTAIRAFFNVCRHRGARLCTEETGEVKRAFQCPYHAWTYDLDGKLVAAPNLTKMPDVGRAEYGLVSVRRPRMARLRLGLPGGRTRPPSRRTSSARSSSRLGDVESIERYDIDGPLGRQADRLRRQGQLEAHHRELHGVLPLRHDPPRTHRGAARVRRRLRRPVLRRPRRRVR